MIRVRRHWAVLLKDLLITFGIVLGAYLLSRLVGGVAGGLWLVQSLLWYIAVGALLRFAWQVLEWWVEVIIVTDKRFMVTSGIIETKNSMMPITKVTDMSFMRPFFGQILGYGTLRIESAGQKQDLEWIYFLPRARGGLSGDLRVDLRREEAASITHAAATAQLSSQALAAPGMARLRRPVAIAGEDCGHAY